MKLARLLIPVLIAAPLAASAMLAAGPSKADETARTISVTGSGSVTALPDMATIRMGAEARALTAADAIAETSAAMRAMLDRATSLGIEERDLQTGSLSLRPIRDQATSGQAQIRVSGFQASNMLQIRVRDLAALGGILDALLSDGANRIDGLSFGLADAGPHEDAARRAAMDDALSRATLYAEAAEVTLGQVRTVTEHGSGARPMMMARAVAMDEAGPAVAPGELTIEAEISVVFDITDP